jgi:hypothetical protein
MSPTKDMTVLEKIERINRDWGKMGNLLGQVMELGSEVETLCLELSKISNEFFLSRRGADEELARLKDQLLKIFAFLGEP